MIQLSCTICALWGIPCNPTTKHPASSACSWQNGQGHVELWIGWSFFSIEPILGNWGWSHWENIHTHMHVYNYRLYIILYIYTYISVEIIGNHYIPTSSTFGTHQFNPFRKDVAGPSKGWVFLRNWWSSPKPWTLWTCPRGIQGASAAFYIGEKSWFNPSMNWNDTLW